MRMRTESVTDRARSEIEWGRGEGGDPWPVRACMRAFMLRRSGARLFVSIAQVGCWLSIVVSESENDQRWPGTVGSTFVVAVWSAACGVTRVARLETFYYLFFHNVNYVSSTLESNSLDLTKSIICSLSSGLKCFELMLGHITNVNRITRSTRNSNNKQQNQRCRMLDE